MYAAAWRIAGTGNRGPEGCSVWGIMRETVRVYLRAGGTRMAAALAFYGTFAIAPALLIASSFAGRVLGEAAAAGQLYEVLSTLLSQDAARLAQEFVAQTGSRTTYSPWPVAVGGVLLLSAVATAFRAFEASVNTVWGSVSRPRSRLKTFTRKGLLPFGLAMLAVVTLAATVVISAVLAPLSARLGERTSLATSAFGSTAISLVAAVVVFMVLFRIVPEQRVSWRTLLAGGVLTGVLFTAGSQVLGLYVGASRLTSFYGVFGIFVALMVWIYYSAQIVLLGATFTAVMARRAGESALTGADD